MRPFRKRLSRLSGLLVCSFTLMGSIQATLAASPKVSMTADRWRTDGKMAFRQREGLAEGLLEIQDGSATLKGLAFKDGTIEFDIRLLDDDMPGVQFRRESADSMEILYLRPSPECPVADDCIQYTPRVHGVMPWEMYPEYQTAAPVSERGWSHVKLVVSGRRMNVFIGHAAMPTLMVGQLEGDARQGELVLVGPAAFANLTVTQDATERLPPGAAADPTAADAGVVRHWDVSKPVPHGVEVVSDLSGMPQASSAWTPVSAEALGLINLSRLYGSPTDRSTGAVAWVKTHVRSDRARSVRATIGYLHEASVFVNGRSAFSGQNLYVAGTPAGRMSALNAASFDLPLKEGDNLIVVALNNILAVGHNHYGWGLKFRLDDAVGLAFSNNPAPPHP